MLGLGFKVLGFGLRVLNLGIGVFGAWVCSRVLQRELGTEYSNYNENVCRDERGSLSVIPPPRGPGLRQAFYV